MKKIELSEQQKEKLLEMCRALFPEYISWQLYNLETGTLNYWSSRARVNSIHWFEFCVLHLSTKIDSFRSDSYLIVHGQSFENSMTSKHPVDYLYEEFLKLKK